MSRHLVQFNIALKAHGPSDYAFGWERIPAALLWKTARCAEPSGQAA